MTSNALLRTDRRVIIKAGIAGLGAAALSSLWAMSARADPSSPTDDTRLMDVVSDLTIPATKVPGARAAGVAAFLATAIAHHTLGARGDEAMRLRHELDVLASKPFLALPGERQHDALSALDAACFAQTARAPNSAWPMVKALILAGYYSSEIGGSVDQHYDLVPGRYDPDIAYRPGDPALSNDWAGVAFR